MTNSPMAGMNTSMEPAMIPGIDKGSVTSRNARHGGLPRSPEASSNERSSFSRVANSGNTMKGRDEVVKFVGAVSTRVSAVDILYITVDFPTASGVWQINDATTLGVRLAGVLPFEEALFFILTTLMVAQTTMLFLWRFDDVPGESWRGWGDAFGRGRPRGAARGRHGHARRRARAGRGHVCQ